MEGTARRVSAFVGAGVVLAAIVGFTVWATSAPGQNNRAGFTAEAAKTSEPGTTTPADLSSASSMTTATVTENETRTVRGSHSPARDGGRQGAAEAEVRQSQRAAGSAPSGYNAERDPYMPPHAVVAPVPESGQPTRVYRPSNIVPSTAPTATTQDHTRPAVEPTPAPGQAGSRTPAPDPEGGTTPGGHGTSNGTPTSPAPASSEPQPADPAEPSRQSAEAPSRRPQSGANPGSEPGAIRDDVSQAPEATEEATPDAPAGTVPPQSVAPQPPAAPVGPQVSSPAPTRVPGKEDVAGYPHEKRGVTPRDVIDRVTGRAAQ